MPLSEYKAFKQQLNLGNSQLQVAGFAISNSLLDLKVMLKTLASESIAEGRILGTSVVR